MDLSSSEIVRNEFGHIESRYFNSAYFGPSPYSSKQKVTRALYKELDPCNIDFDQFFYSLPEQIRDQFAGLLGCDSNQVCLTTSSSDLLSIISHGIELNSDDIAVVFKGEFPSNVLPWMVAEKNRGIKVEFLDHALPTADWLKENLPKNAKVVTMSHVAFDTGRKIDIKAIGKLLRERDILFILDATQSLGGLAITKEELDLVDILTCSTYKWMLGPYGAAFGYFTNKALGLIKNQTGNWITSPTSKGGKSLSNYTIETLEGARRFDRGQSPNALINGCLSGAFDVLAKIGLSNIENHNIDIRNYFLDILPKNKFEIKTPIESMGNILSLYAPKIESSLLERNLKQNNIEVSIREGNIRLSFHLFNSREQVEALAQVLDQ